MEVKLRRWAAINANHLVEVLVLGHEIPGQIDLKFVHVGEEPRVFLVERPFVFELAMPRLKTEG